MKIPPDIKAALKACPLPFEFRKGGKHTKLYVRGRMIGSFTATGKVKGDIGHLAIVKRIRAAVAAEGGAA